MNQQGMTLIEVMVAMAVLATAGLALMNISRQQLGNLDYLEQKQIAGWVADNQLALAQLQPRVGPAPQQGESLQAGRLWYWTLKSIATTQPGIVALEVEVRTSPESEPPLARLHSWRAQ